LINSDKYIAATHANNSLIGPPTLIANVTTPATPGETIVLYANGFGMTNPAVANGQIISTPVPLQSLPTVMFNNTPATVVYGGQSASGLYQLNVKVPTGLPDGDATVTAQTGGVTSPAGALITINN
jgi:uncharacterized protein (TIGR03437 family)